MTPEEKKEEFLATVIDSVGDGVIVIDLDGRIALMNPAAEEITGISRRQAVGHRFALVFHREEVLREMVGKTASSGMTISDHENIVIRKLKQLTPVSATTFPLMLPHGETTGTILVLRDITSIRELEDAVRNADRLSTLGTLAAGLAHEIKNPLGGIKGAAQLLELELPTESELRDNVRIMLKEVERVNRIVEELLALASPRGLQLSKVNLHKVIGDILTLQKRSTEGKNVAFQQQFDPSIPPILADEGLLTQLFLNLVKNAMEAVDDGGCIRVASRVISDYSMTQKGERRSRMVAIDVADDGPGIQPEQLEQLFTPFFTTKTKGTGLGLAICQKIVTEHRGMIKVESDPGKGTTFTVMLPLIQ
ncbi:MULTISPECIES: nitrogen fixation sensor histidine kinase GnfL [Geobacter]|uniref:nitrogen fixation sensor histidine kinase GnfL n=1 Tax=Geobacter TaxID=28231 RepID=UPI002573A864|nr:nitrogen fixation sensor histidine kinase GnfL [Geobacter sulfurreducens]BEH10994.1 nitrogen fixation sensor histidine kinase GnfL [Geobacter sulfurreducens subsp. ethanolicus]BET58838.1 nitrogen fixation sensor histidine kinase GnfL [Geobacter sp. 60473]